MNWIYKQTEPSLWTVGFYGPDGTWHTDSDHASKAQAGNRAAILNGGRPATCSWGMTSPATYRYVYTECGRMEPVEKFDQYTYCPHCGGKIEKI